jgi:hypothetical protein
VRVPLRHVRLTLYKKLTCCCGRVTLCAVRPALSHSRWGTAGAAETDKRSPPKKSPSKRSPAKRSTTNLAGPAPVAEDAAAAEPLPEQQQQQQEQVTDRPTAPSGEDSVGLRIRVYWKGDRAWYSGHIAAYSKGRHQGECVLQSLLCVCVCVCVCVHRLP